MRLLAWLSPSFPTGAYAYSHGLEWAVECGDITDGDTLCVAHGHILRVLAARWLGLPPVAGRLFLLYPGHLCVLGWERESPALEWWNEAPG